MDDTKKDDTKKDDTKKDDTKKDDTPKCKVALKFYSDAGCKKDAAADAGNDAAAKKASDLVGKACADNKVTTCTDEGVVTTTYKDDKCKTKVDKDAEVTVKWSECKEITKDKLYHKMTGAKALMAGAAAALAFVSSQF